MCPVLRPLMWYYIPLSFVFQAVPTNPKVRAYVLGDFLSLFVPVSFLRSSLAAKLSSRVSCFPLRVFAVESEVALMVRSCLQKPVNDVKRGVVFLLLGVILSSLPESVSV